MPIPCRRALLLLLPCLSPALARPVIDVNGVGAAPAGHHATKHLDLTMKAPGRVAFHAGDNLLAVHCHHTVAGSSSTLVWSA